MNFRFKKPNSKITTIIIGVVLLALILPNFAHALFGLDAESIAKSILAWLTHIILSFFSIFVDLAARFLEAMLNIGFASHKGISEIGWKVVRDFSNMFFILFMVVIAFATILRIERYGIKELLPKVIIIALLINFSLVICYVIIDFCDIAANYFIHNAKVGFTEKQTIATTLMDGLNLTKVIIPTNCLQIREDALSTCDLMSTPEKKTECRNIVETNFKTCEAEAKKIAATTNQEGSFINMVVSTIFGSVILMVAAFILFVGGILILVRLFFLWFLVMLVPFVFLCYLMPGLRGNWQKWWKSFLSWCFFAPVYTFFIWLAIKITLEKRLDQTIGVSVDATGNQTLGTAFFGTTDNLIAYLFTLALLVGGLIAAKQMGIYGASTAMTIGQKWGKAAGAGMAKWSGARVREGLAKPMEKVSAGLAKTIGRIPGFKGLAKAPAEVMKAQRAAIEKEKKNLGVHSMDTLKTLYPTFNKTQKIAAAQLMAEKGKLAKGGNFRDKDVEKIIKVTNAYGKDLANTLLINRPDLAPTVGQTKKEAVERISPAKAGNIQTEAFQDTPTMTLILQTFRGAHLDKIADASIKNADLIQDAIHDLDPTGTPATREAILKIMNPKLTVYINNAAMKGTGLYDFG